jgi:hypothetical protein
LVAIIVELMAPYKLRDSYFKLFDIDIIALPLLRSRLLLDLGRSRAPCNPRSNHFSVTT